MGDTFQIGWAVLCGHAVENHFARSGTPTVGRTDVGTPTNHSNALPTFQRQPQNRLQVARTFSPARRTRPAGPFAAATAFTPSPRGDLGQSHPPVASPPITLGAEKNPSPAAPNFSASVRPLCPLDSAVLAALATRDTAPAPRAQGAAPPHAGLDATHPPQSGLDGGFQGLVSHRRWPAAGAVDGTRSIQSFRIVCAVATQSGRRAGAPGFPAFIPPARVAGQHPGRQRFALRRHGCTGVVAAVGLVVALGHPCRVHPAGAAG